MAETKNTPPRGQNITESPDARALSLVHSPICWPAIFAGLFVALISYVALMSLGLAIGGRSLYDIVQSQDSLQSLGLGAALWTIASAIIALFVGGHMSGRVAGIIPTRVGRTQGLVITSLFFMIMFTQVGILIGALGGGLNTALSAMGSSTINSTVGQNIIEDAVGDLNLKSSPSTVVQGVASRLMAGDENAALNYIANQAGISPQEAQQRLDSFKAKYTATMQQAGLTAARTLRSAGWTLLLAIVLGAAAGMAGGGIAANFNLREPISAADDRALHHRLAPAH